MSELVGVVRDLRRRAKDDGNEGLSLAWKTTVNSIYGVMASPHHPTFNVVAANQVSARGRALAFLLGQTLNAITTITDGCIYRADRIPAGTFGTCLRRHPRYPAELADVEHGMKFLDPRDVPGDDAGFNAWLVPRVARFFGAPEAEVRALFGAHRVEHKATDPGGAAFDALAIDGPGNYVKCLGGASGWAAADAKLRGYGRDARAAVVPYLIGTYSTDTMSGLPPAPDQSDLLAPASAVRAAKGVLERGAGRVLFPLGYTRGKVLNYKAIKLSAFLFRTPRQRRKVLAQVQKFEAKHRCGLELLALRRTYQGRRHGSVADLAGAVRDAVRDGRDRLDKVLNLGRLDAAIAQRAEARGLDAEARRARGRVALERAITVGVTDLPTTGAVLDRDALGRVGSL